MRTEPRAQATCWQNFGEVRPRSWSSSCASRQTDRQTDILIAIFYTPPSGEGPSNNSAIMLCWSETRTGASIRWVSRHVSVRRSVFVCCVPTTSTSTGRTRTATRRYTCSSYTNNRCVPPSDRHYSIIIFIIFIIEQLQICRAIQAFQDKTVFLILEWSQSWYLGYFVTNTLIKLGVFRPGTLSCGAARIYCTVPYVPYRAATQFAPGSMWKSL